MAANDLNMDDLNEVQLPKKVHRRNPLLPPRPKRPPTAYSVFLKKYFTENRVRNAAEARDTMKTAATAWKALPENEKNRYNRSCQKAKEAYKEVMAKWRRQKAALKQPASSYALFLKSVWAMEGANGRTVGEVGHHAAELWRKMTDEERKVYHRAQQDRADNYYGMVGLLRSGDMNIQEVGDVANAAVQNQQDQGQVPDVPEEGEGMEN